MDPSMLISGDREQPSAGCPHGPDIWDTPVIHQRYSSRIISTSSFDLKRSIIRFDLTGTAKGMIYEIRY
jgi:hypothetical protein